MSLDYINSKKIRKSFGKIPLVTSLPNLIEVQKRSFDNFLQLKVKPEAFENQGLHAVFKSVFPINDYTERATVDYVNSAITAGGGSLVALSDTNIAAAADAHVLVYDASNGWQNKEMTGHVSIDKTGATAVVDLPGGLVTDAMMHANMNYVSTITAGDNISFTGGSSGSGKASTPTIALSDDVTIAGNLVVNGTTSTVDSTTVSIADPIFKLGSGADAAVAACDRGIEIGYVDSGSAKLGFFGMDMTDSKFKFITNGTNTGDQFSGDAGNVLFGDIEGTIKTVAQNHIESATSLTAVGDITLGTWNGTAISSGRGGTGIDSSSASGVASVTGGTWSIDSNLSVAYGGTGAGTFTAKGIMYGNDAGALQVTAAGAEGNMLRAGTGGTPEWTNTLDGGEF